MIFTTFAKERRDELRSRMNDLADFLAGGGANSYDHYKDVCGEIRGLAIAERQLLDAAEKLEKVGIND